MNAVAPLSLFGCAPTEATCVTEVVLAVPSSSFVVHMPVGDADTLPHAPVLRLTPAQRAQLASALGVDISAVIIRPDKVRHTVV